MKTTGPLARIREAALATERDAIRLALDASGWRISRAARALGCGVSTLQTRIRVVGLAEEYAERRGRTAK